MKNYYDLLGVDKNSTTEQINRAYNKILRKYQNDEENIQNQEMMEELKKAYECLSDPKEKIAYDLYGENYKQQLKEEEERKKEEAEKKEPKTISWIISVVLILAGIGGFSEYGFMVAVLWCASGLLLCPAIIKDVKKSTKIIIAILLLLVSNIFL